MRVLTVPFSLFCCILGGKVFRKHSDHVNFIDFHFQNQVSCLRFVGDSLDLLFLSTFMPFWQGGGALWHNEEVLNGAPSLEKLHVVYTGQLSPTPPFSSIINDGGYVGDLCTASQVFLNGGFQHSKWDTLTANASKWVKDLPGVGSDTVDILLSIFWFLQLHLNH